MFLLATYSLHAFTFHALLLTKSNGEFLFTDENDNQPLKKKSGCGVELLRLLVKHNTEKRNFSVEQAEEALADGPIASLFTFHNPVSISFNAPPLVCSPSIYKRYCTLRVLLI
ncbi:MAG: hypothetical protein U0V74_13700 [Chitinophagales bacterium]